MIHILVLSLGKQPDGPIQTIRGVRPDRVVFICSQESQDLIRAIQAQVPVPDFDADRDVMVLQQRRPGSNPEASNELDRLDSVYGQASALLERLGQEHPGCRLTVDYTGGTKSMGAGLAMAAIDDPVANLQLTTLEQRVPGSTVITGHSFPVPVPTEAIHAHRLLSLELPTLLQRFDYAAAEGAIGRVRRGLQPESEAFRTLTRLETLMVALDAWDRFDHRTSVQLLNGRGREPAILALLLPLKRVVSSRKLVDARAREEDWPSMPGHGLELAEDLLRNAERRAAQHRYDDAVGRLYRAVELTAQLLLRTGVADYVGKEGIDTSDVATERLPEILQPTYRSLHERKGVDQPLKLGLVESYELLAALLHPVGLRWKQRDENLRRALKLRNASQFAHGFEAIGYSGWQTLWSTCGLFVQEAIAEIRDKKGLDPLPQLPFSLAATGAEPLAR